MTDYQISEDDLENASIDIVNKNVLRGMYKENPRTHMNREGDES